MKSCYIAITLISAILLTTLPATYAKTDLSHGRKQTHWVMPRTPDGQPDFQGVWTNGTLTLLERPTELADKAFFTQQEFDTQEQLAEQRGRIIRDPDRIVENEAFVENDYKLFATRQTSLVIDPPNGRIPLRPDQEKYSDANAINFADYQTLSPWDRCISLGPTTLFPKFINNAIRIVQTRDHVVIAAETIADARAIPLGNMPHVDARVTAWMGDSRAHFEGDTLVIDTTNFNNRRMVTSIALGASRNLPMTDTLHTVERLRRVSENTIEYQITFDDPKVFTQPWTVAFPFTRDDRYQIFEYACHEGNYAMEAILRGAR